MKRLALILTVISALVMDVAAQKATVTARTDSTYILMGQVTSLHIEALGNLSDDAAIVPADTGWSDVEILAMDSTLRQDMGNGRVRLTRELILQSFDSGLYRLPPVYLVNQGESIAANGTILKVVPVAVDSMSTIHDYAPVTAYPRHFFDFLPQWLLDWGWWVILIVIVLAAAGYYYYKNRGITPQAKAEARRLPPYEEAMAHLDKLRASKLCERGEEKAYYTELVDILRIYLHRRFGINAMEMTSSQIRHALNSNDTTRPSQAMMARVLEMADFVKFAKMRPLPEDNVASFNSAIDFVEQTRPAPEPEPEQADDSTQD